MENGWKNPVFEIHRIPRCPNTRYWNKCAHLECRSEKHMLLEFSKAPVNKTRQHVLKRAYPGFNQYAWTLQRHLWKCETPIKPKTDALHISKKNGLKAFQGHTLEMSQVGQSPSPKHAPGNCLIKPDIFAPQISGFTHTLLSLTYSRDTVGT